MSIVRGALGLASLAVAASAYRVMREASAEDPAVAVGALVVTAAATSAAAHLLAREVGEVRRLARGQQLLLEDGN